MDPGRITGLYSDLCALAVPVRAHVKEQKLNGQTLYDVNTEWTQNDLVRGSRLSFCQRWTLLVEDKHRIQSVLPPGPAVPLNTECLSSFSPVQGLRAVIRELSGHQLLEVWDERGLRKCLNLTALNKHGRVYEDAQFGCLSWSRCENKLLYVAEKKTESPNASSGNVEERSVYREDWGEALSNKSVPVLCCVDLRTGDLSMLQGAPADVSPGQAVWSLDGESVFFVGWFHEPYRLGLNFCTNRKSALFQIDLAGHCERLSEENVSVLSPRLSPDGSALVFLQGKVFGPHAQCLKMQMLDLKSKKISTLIDVVHRAQNGDNSVGGFAGVYESLRSCCWSEDSQRIVFSSAHKNWKDIFVVDRQTQRVSCLSDSKPPPLAPLSSPTSSSPLSSSLSLTSFPPPPSPGSLPFPPSSFFPSPPSPLPLSPLSPPLPLTSLSVLSEPPLPPLPHLNHEQDPMKNKDISDGLRVFGSWRLLTIHRDLMVVCCSSPNTPPTLRVGFLPSDGQIVCWKTVQPPLSTFDFPWTVMDVWPSPEEDNGKYTGLDFGAILVKPSSQGKTKLPLVVFIHGGPHAQFPAEWNITAAGLVQLGLAVLMVNYRGSTGFGQDSILSLIGQIGHQDVKDVQRAVQFALQTNTTLDPERLAVFGGSHGGFLSCHLIGQFPDVYRACAVRNPVVNAATLLGTSDIIDWRYSCIGMDFSYEQIPTAEALATMLQRSPITHAPKMKCALLLMLGARDRRVSPHQGLELYRALKSRGRTVRLLWFPEDGHSLSRVDTQTDCFLNTVLWLQEHL